jgi:hypothetical protein
MRDWVEKFKTGEYLREWRGFNPHWLGCFYGQSVTLGGEDEFSHCYDFFSGIGDVEWWITAEIEKLSEDEKERMYSLMNRNKSVDEMLVENSHIINTICDNLDITSEYIYRLGNKLIKELVESENPTELYKNFLTNDKIVNRLSFDEETESKLIDNGILPNNLEKFQLWYIDGMIPKCTYVDKYIIEVLNSNGFNDDNIPLREDLESILNIKL